MLPENNSYRGRVDYVETRWDRLLILLDLGFGHHVQMRFAVDGVPYQDVKAMQKKDARHCMVVLVGGKKVLVQANAASPANADVAPYARVYLDERVAEPPDGTMIIPHRTSQPLLCVGDAMAAIASRGFSVDYVKQILNGRKRA